MFDNEQGISAYMMRIELAHEMKMVAESSVGLGHHVSILPLAIETLEVCANVTGDRSVSRIIR